MFMRKSLISIIWLLLLCWASPGWPGQSQSPWSPDLTLQQATVDCATDHLYVREKTGNNDSPEIDQWLDYVGVPRGNPYCAAFAVSMYTCGAKQTGKQGSPLPKIARVSALYKAAQKNPYKYKTFPAVRVKQGIEKLELADLPCWAHGQASGNFNGHVGLNLFQLSTEFFRTIEANTGPGDAGNQREGDGVYRRLRKLELNKTFKVVGFIRVK